MTQKTEHTKEQTGKQRKQVQIDKAMEHETNTTMNNAKRMIGKTKS